MLLVLFLFSRVKLSHAKHYFIPSFPLHIREFAVAICRESLPQEFAVGICRKEFAMAIWRGFFVFVRKSFLYIWANFVYMRANFFYMWANFLFVRLPLLTVFLFVITAVMDHRNKGINISSKKKKKKKNKWINKSSNKIRKIPFLLYKSKVFKSWIKVPFIMMMKSHLFFASLKLHGNWLDLYRCHNSVIVYNNKKSSLRV